jgi:hypothetical protein
MRSIQVCALAVALTASGIAVAGTGKPATPADTGAKAPATQEYVVRDWAKMDKNKDNLISPEEMTAYIDAHPGPLAKQKQAAQKVDTPRTAAATTEPATSSR